MKKKELEELALDLGLSFDGQSGLIYGQRRGFPFYLEPVTDQGQFAIFFSVGTEAGRADTAVLEALTDFSDVLIDYERAGYCLAYAILPAPDLTELRDHLEAAIEDCTYYFEEEGLLSACEKTGRTGRVALYQVGGKWLFLTPTSYEKLLAIQETRRKEAPRPQRPRQRENFLLGFVGALLGSLAGAPVVFLLTGSQRLMSLTAVLVGFLTVSGYRLLGKGLSLFGGIVSLVLASSMSLLAFQLRYAQIYYQDRMPLSEAFAAINRAALSGQLSDDYWFTGLLVLGLSILTTAYAAKSIEKMFG
ncbi:hypothetical protein STRDD11_01382 [Streptococcus sp. DD11]|uniref:hypothetical protein n=1 Tax=Streptococcus sp. DD11 TaxID=1777879 RepID=UPI0007915C31|nr:hypothetical protein [Streptococcus sp. DD11]KXT83603.1 hypothetical protein STRDD11_01382 [Streptococcus sp. DD11]